MVRVFTFLGLLAGTYVGVKALDNVVVWMAERRQANMEDMRIERDAVMLKQQLLKEIQEKQAILDEVKNKNKHSSHKHSDKHWQQTNENKSLGRHQEDYPGVVVAECVKCGEIFEIAERVPHSPKER